LDDFAAEFVSVVVAKIASLHYLQFVFIAINRLGLAAVELALRVSAAQLG
jgi:hypothetical protein